MGKIHPHQIEKPWLSSLNLSLMEWNFSFWRVPAYRADPLAGAYINACDAALPFLF
jgi:hypothetical protein